MQTTSTIPSDRTQWDDDLIKRLLELHRPVMQCEMVNFLLKKRNKKKLLDFVFKPTKSTAIDQRPTLRGNVSFASTEGKKRCPPQVIMSYRATAFLTGGFENDFSHLSRKHYNALSQFYCASAPLILSLVFDSLAQKPIKCNLCHIHKLWQAVIHFNQSAVARFFSESSPLLEDRVGILLELSHQGIVSTMLTDLLCGFASSIFSGSTPLKASKIELNVINALSQCKILTHITEILCGERNGFRSVAHCTAISDLFSRVLNTLAPKVSLRFLKYFCPMVLMVNCSMYTSRKDVIIEKLKVLSFALQIVSPLLKQEHAYPILRSFGLSAMPAFDAFARLLNT